MTRPPGGRLGHFTPLRYPGGKGKLAPFIKSIMEANELTDGHYVEPYAGGAALALELLFHEYVSHIHINDISKPIYAFWRSVLTRPDEFAERVLGAELTVSEWDRQKAIFRSGPSAGLLDLGFATFYLNRTNRSGILNAGIIGGRAQSGEWKLDARFNAVDLAQRILSIGGQAERISLTNEDARTFLENGSAKWPARTLVYLDPPYFEKGRHLYYDFYKPDDHKVVAECVRQTLRSQQWIVSYDDVPEIAAIYVGETSLRYRIGYSARAVKAGAEVMFFKDGLVVPPLQTPMLPSEPETEFAAAA